MPITDAAIRKAKPQEKAFRLFDGGGLYLEVAPSGGKLWRWKYRFQGTEKRLALGTYPDVSLRLARDKHSEGRKSLAAGIDPSTARKAEKQSQAGSNSFEAIAREWHEKFSPRWVASHGERILKRLEVDLFPWIGKRPISEIKAPDLLSALRRIEGRGAVETAHRALQNAGQIFRYAIATGRADRDISSDLRGALPPTKEKHHASIIEPLQIGELLRAIDTYSGTLVTKCALRLAPLVFVRPGELRKAEWSEINFETAEWHIPAERMKMREKHIVPLSQQSLDILNEIKPLTGFGIPAKPNAPRYIFPGGLSRLRPMSENAILAALRRMGYSKDEMTGHGFRSMASTRLHEMGWEHHVIERQLAHAERNAVSAAYNYAEHLPRRREMMQAWADYLDELKRDIRIIPMAKIA